MEKVAVDIKNNHPFWRDYNNKLRTVYAIGLFIPRKYHAQYIKEWYGYEAEMQPYDTAIDDTVIVLHMTQQEHTLFALKYGS